MSEELAARLMARIAVPPMPFAPDTYTAGRMDQFTEMITQLRALPEVDKEQVLADAKARIGRLAAPNGSYGEAEWGFLRGVTAALAALTQPQTEIEGKPDGTWYDIPDGGGAAKAAGARGADLVTVELTRDEALALDGRRCSLRAVEDSARAKVRAAHESFTDVPGPYARAFRERVCPVPEFPGIEVHINGNPDMDPETAETLREAMIRAYDYMAENPSVGTAPQRPKADPPYQMGRVDCESHAPVPQTEGECPDCEDGTLYDPDALPLAPTVPCPTCSGTGKEGEK